MRNSQKVIDFEHFRPGLEPDWRDIMWKTSHSEVLSDKNGVLQDPGCNPSKLLEAYENVISAENEDTMKSKNKTPDSIYAGVTFCGPEMLYPRNETDFYIGKTKEDARIDRWMNFDFTSSKFNQVCFSTCCWTFIVSA